MCTFMCAYVFIQYLRVIFLLFSFKADVKSDILRCSNSDIAKLSREILQIYVGVSRKSVSLRVGNRTLREEIRRIRSDFLKGFVWMFVFHYYLDSIIRCIYVLLFSEQSNSYSKLPAVRLMLSEKKNEYLYFRRGKKLIFWFHVWWEHP